MDEFTDNIKKRKWTEPLISFNNSGQAEGRISLTLPSALGEFFTSPYLRFCAYRIIMKNNSVVLFHNILKGRLI